MVNEKEGKVIKGLGGLYEVKTDGGEVLFCRAKGILKRDEEKVLIGDRVVVRIDDETPDSIVISGILPRKCALIRPPMSNLDYLFIVFAAAKPQPVLETVDKLTAIAYHNDITPVIVITKSDMSRHAADEFASVYKKAGIPTFVTSTQTEEGLSELSEYIKSYVKDGATAAFAGASGVGKSTLMNALFPNLSLSTGEISRKIERGKHTTRHVEIFDIGNGGFLADTPGFSLIDFARFDFFTVEELLPAFPDVMAHGNACRYADCAHVGEGVEDCSVARAKEQGDISESRLDSYRSIYKTLKNKINY
ncbi:MAG: ribosome small subunit-dependent GTPase A [Clostridia bacterium]|nr:ribosome small subunit-dependent GTPase A [Clostridia bacterium]